MEITEFEKKRAANLIWNGAHDYTIETGFRVYDEDGRADLYWNSIIGAVHLHYDWAQLMLFYNSFHETVDQGVYESLFWIAVENAAYEREKEERPVFPYLRRSYAQKKLRSMTGQISEDAAQQRLLAVTYGHFRRALGEDAGLPDLVDVHLLNELELLGELDTGELISRIAAALGRYFGFDPNGRRFLSGDRRVLNPLSLFSLRGRRGKEDVPAGPVRRMSFGYGEHVYEYGSELLDQSRLRSSFAQYTAQADNGMKAYLEGVFGRSALDERAAARLEKNYCCGNHAGARLYVTRGEYGQELPAETAGSYVRRMRREVLQQREKNEKAFAGNRGLYRVQMEKLTARIRNSVMKQLDEQAVRRHALRRQSLARDVSA